jgi:hypothetical protein
MTRKNPRPGITIGDVWTYYTDYHKSVNEISRQIAYAGIALIWVFRVTGPGQVHIPKLLFISGFFLILCLFFDYLQYIVGAITYQIYGTYKEKQVTASETFQQPDSLLHPMDALFFLKIIAAIIGYIFAMKYLLDNVL